MTEWKKYEGTDEQIAEMMGATKGWIVKFDTGIESGIYVSHPQLHVNLSSVKEYLICEPHPLADMISQQAQTGQPVWIRGVCLYAKQGYKLIDADSWTYVTTRPDWNIPGAEYSFTPFED